MGLLIRPAFIVTNYRGPLLSDLDCFSGTGLIPFSDHLQVLLVFARVLAREFLEIPSQALQLSFVFLSDRLDLVKLLCVHVLVRRIISGKSSVCRGLIR